MNPHPSTAELAAFASETAWDTLSPDVQALVRRSVARTLSQAIANSRDPVIATLTEVLSGHGPSSQVSILGRSERLSLSAGAMVNGTAAHRQPEAGVGPGGLLHPATPIVPAALAMAEHVRSDAATFLAAVAVALEITMRLSYVFGSDHTDRGWDPTGTIGHIGAAVAAARAAPLDQTAYVVAIGLGATQAAGLQANGSSAAGALHAGKAAADGTQAALLAASGFSGPPAPIEGRRGLAALCTSGFDDALLTNCLGERWRIAELADIGELASDTASRGATERRVSPVLGGATDVFVSAVHDLDSTGLDPLLAAAATRG